jgi:hypothetical protein
MKMYPVRALPAFGAAANVTEPAPLPAPDMIVIQLSGLDAVQPHALDVVTVIGIPVPPVVAIDCVCGVNEY